MSGAEAQHPIPPEALLTPLLDAAVEVLRSLEPEDVPASLRALRGFRTSGMSRGAARVAVLRALVADDDFRKRAVEQFLARPEAQAALDAWDVREVEARVDAAAGRGDLPLLASALYAARPNGWWYGLGVVSGVHSSARRADEADAESKALRLRADQADEARRRAEAARADAVAAATRVEAELREERASRRAREERAERRVAASEQRAAELVAEGERLQRAFEAAAAREEQAHARARALEAEVRALQARRESAGRLTIRDADLDVLRDAADLATRLAAGLTGVARRIDDATSARPRTPDAHGSPTATRPPAPSAPPASTAASGRPRPPSRRLAVKVPAGMRADAPAAVEPMLRTPNAALVIDGYNVTMRGWPDAPPVDQRERLVQAVSALQIRTRCDATIVFDGADVGVAGAPRRPGVRVVFSAEDQEADEVVVAEVAARPRTAPVVVVSSDAWVRQHAEAEGALVISADTLLAALRA